MNTSTITDEFCPADRYVYDMGLCSIDNGFAQFDTGSDASYFGTWANPSKLIIFSYMEGDCRTEEFHSKEAFCAGIRELVGWNNEKGDGFKGIDCGFFSGNPIEAEFVSLGLGEFLHGYQAAVAV